MTKALKSITSILSKLLTNNLLTGLSFKIISSRYLNYNFLISLLISYVSTFVTDFADFTNFTIITQKINVNKYKRE